MTSSDGPEASSASRVRYQVDDFIVNCAGYSGASRLSVMCLARNSHVIREVGYLDDHLTDVSVLPDS